MFAAYVVGGAVGAEAGLTFLGVGLRLPAISWGLQLAIADTKFPEYGLSPRTLQQICHS